MNLIQLLNKVKIANTASTFPPELGIKGVSVSASVFGLRPDVFMARYSVSV